MHRISNNPMQEAARALLETPLRDVVTDRRNRESLLLSPGLDYAAEHDPARLFGNRDIRPLQQVPLSPDGVTLREALSIMANKYLGDPFVREATRRRARADHAADYRALVEKTGGPLAKFLALYEALAALADDGTPPDAAVLRGGIATLRALADEAEAAHTAFRDRMLSRERLEEDHYAQKTYALLEALAQAEEKPAAFPQALFDRIRRGGDDALPADLDHWLRRQEPMTEADYAQRSAVNTRFVALSDPHDATLLRHVADQADTLAQGGFS